MVTVQPAIVRKRAASLLAALFALVAFGALSFLLAPPAHAEIRFTDAAGREVRLAKPAERIATNESLLLLSLALIEPDPISRIAGWAAPQRIDRGYYNDLKQRFPAIDAIPVAGGVMASTTSPEAILAVSPDVFIVSIWDQGWMEIAATLESAGVPVVFLDGPQNKHGGPADTTIFSLELLGKVIGREAEARTFGEFLRPRYQRITGRTSGIARKSVLVDAHAGAICCSTPGRENRMTDYLRLAGGDSIGADMPGYDGRLSAEFVMEKDPDVYIATGGPHLAAQGGLVLGGDVGAEAAAQSFAHVVTNDVRANLTAVREGRAHALSHQLSISVLNILVFECYAKWIHPELFEDIDPNETLAEINRLFLSVPLKGTFWLDFDASRLPQ
ncbi:ABC transporter substrate-binding protein [Pararhizobium sp. DWP3-4]|uniref:ABC transporter substrate-binding protein n=1 Tax=Pararhizobium sp. DWP3-4 TaxID=2804565 RepID=UPI003CE88052